MHAQAPIANCVHANGALRPSMRSIWLVIWALQIIQTIRPYSSVCLIAKLRNRADQLFAVARQGVFRA